MEMTEIKKAFEQMKKDAKKELGISYGFTMSAKQIKNRTATLSVCNDIPYEDEIRRAEADDRRVQSYDTWTAEEKANCHARTIANVEAIKTKLAKYGTKQKEAEAVERQITNSKAFKRFREAVGDCVTTIDHMDICYYIRFHY